MKQIFKKNILAITLLCSGAIKVQCAADRTPWCAAAIQDPEVGRVGYATVITDQTQTNKNSVYSVIAATGAVNRKSNDQVAEFAAAPEVAADGLAAKLLCSDKELLDRKCITIKGEWWIGTGLTPRVCAIASAMQVPVDKTVIMIRSRLSNDMSEYIILTKKNIREAQDLVSCNPNVMPLEKNLELVCKIFNILSK